MTEMQEKLLDILKWFHEFCEENNLKYYIIGGTLLGAVRHGGFIPWDDDIDVGMPRSDYEKLREICLKQEKSQFMFEFPNSAKDYPYLWAKLYDTNTTFIEKKRKNVKRGLYLDIFPLDGIGNSIDEAIINYGPIKRNVRLDLMISCAILKRRKWHKNLSIVLGRIISPLFVNKQKLGKKIDDLCKKNRFDDCKIVSNLLGGTHVKGMLDREIFGTPTLIKFESLNVYGVEKPELYLKSIYGDYMKLPPEKNRISYHDSVYLDLNKGYWE